MFVTVPHYQSGGLYGGTVPIENGAPPSTYAVAAVLKNEPGSFARLIGVTILRAIFIVPGLWAAGKIIPGVKIDLPQSIGVGLTASASISIGLLGWYYLKSKMLEWEAPYA